MNNGKIMETTRVLVQLNVQVVAKRVSHERMVRLKGALTRDSILTKAAVAPIPSTGSLAEAEPSESSSVAGH